MATDICGKKRRFLSRPSQRCLNTFKSVVRVLGEAGGGGGGGGVTKAVLCRHFQVGRRGRGDQVNGV